MILITERGVEILTRLACKHHRPEYTTEVAWREDVRTTYQDEELYTINSDIPNQDVLPYQNGTEVYFTLSDSNNMEKCAKDPVVEAAVAQLMTSEYSPRAVYML